ncbi:hypothetical protein P872_25510 [Rhodonellum psychrophilum GCM71 = DSM 17998]|uniref:Uncharacterized protein n=2 Tax=Rhodonellum TaxID=336827 RepID=U5C8J3_9BACT|nr:MULTISPECIES: hypothetical protein [Rhodonellum]ERM84517.1 hypothetical protein P872_25510 [Rhodonellum psychrophilum GCM71 = DSM 17998]SDZ01830.1 hypothetical protein SAMN05444412_104330 [Rhodonellum ikkaensis]
MTYFKKVLIYTALIFFGIILVDFVIEVGFRRTDIQTWLSYVTHPRVWLTRLFISVGLALYNVWKFKKRAEDNDKVS